MSRGVTGGDMKRLVIVLTLAGLIVRIHGQGTYAEMQKRWTELQPTVAYFEGTGNFIGATLTESLERSGEPGLVRYLARDGGIVANSLEPSTDQEVESLLKSFTAEQLILFYVARAVVEERDRRGVSTASVDSLLGQNLDQIHRVTKLAATLPTADAFRAAFNRWFPDMNPAAAPTNWFDPLRTSEMTGSKFLNDVNRASSALRDVHMYQTLAASWKPGARIFAEVGRDHIPAQAAALRCALR